MRIKAKTRHFLVWKWMICFCLVMLGSPKVWSQEMEKLPTIEGLTKGTVKLGDIIDKSNVDLVRDYLPESVYECVNQGMVLIMGEHLPLDKLVPTYFLEETEKNKGKAVMDEIGTVYLKDGSTWPGGLPFPEPKTGLEAMANNKYGNANDDFSLHKQWMLYNNSEGETYKSLKMYVSYVYTTHRMACEPLGALPGLEDENYRRVSVFLSPLKMRGLGQFSIRYYDEGKNVDSGFAYLPAFKRTLRVSATTYQDNIGGSDVLYCDPTGVNDPYVYWDFKLIGEQFVLTSATKSHVPAPLADGDGLPDKSKIKFDIGEKYPRMSWAITPVYVIEARPTVKHVYGKKVIYLPKLPVWVPDMQIQVVDIYDRNMEIYKSYIAWRGGYETDESGNNWGHMWGFDVHDLQTKHSSRNWFTIKYNTCFDAKSYNLKKLLEFGK